MATKLGTLAPTFCFSSTSINNTKKSVGITNIPTSTRIQNYPHGIQQFSRTPPFIPVVRASSGPNSPEPTSPTNTHNSAPPPLQEDLTYLLKLAAGSVLGSALIKYGSAIIPDITRPNLTQALLMISTPVVIAILLLLIGSRKE